MTELTNRMAATTTAPETTSLVKIETLQRAFELMHTAKRMAELYDEHKQIASKYVHSTSRGHEAIQLAAAFQLLPQDYAYP